MTFVLSPLEPAGYLPTKDARYPRHYAARWTLRPKKKTETYAIVYFDDILHMDLLWEIWSSAYKLNKSNFQVAHAPNQSRTERAPLERTALSRLYAELPYDYGFIPT